jgi:hypothetical protein
VPVPSTVKVRQAIDQLVAQLPQAQQQAAGMTAIALAAIGPFLPGLIAQAVDVLPDDPAKLDELLQHGADYLLSLRSDEQPEPPADVAELPEAVA